MLNFNSSDAPAIFPRISHAGIEGDLIAAGEGGAAVVRFAYLFHAGNRVSAALFLGRKGDAVPDIQRVDFSEVGVGPPVVVE